MSVFGCTVGLYVFAPSALVVIAIVDTARIRNNAPRPPSWVLRRTMKSDIAFSV